MSNTKHEDAIMKMGFGYFQETILEKLGIHYEFDSSAPTELIELTIHTLYMDFTFLTKQGFYVHIEFQTTETDRSDLLRFRSYEAILYTLADKFLNQIELQEIKEVVAMTRLGQMIYDDGMERGIERGSIEKLTELIIRRMQKGDTPEQIAELLEEDVTMIRKIYTLVQEAGASCDLSKICEKILNS